MKGVMRFGKKGKLSPRYVGPYRILKRIDGTHGHHPRTVDGLTVHHTGSWFVTEKFPITLSENLAKCRLTDRPRFVVCARGSRLPLPASNTNYGRPVRTIIRST
ncbi:hypothetical protein MTR67_018346, partial [Solanum verrucosum]